MDRAISYSSDMLVNEAEKILKNHGLIAENIALGLIKVASSLIWNNADPEKDEMFIHWITSKELYVTEYIGELHKTRIKQYLSE